MGLVHNCVKILEVNLISLVSTDLCKFILQLTSAFMDFEQPDHVSFLLSSVVNAASLCALPN